MPLVQGWHCRAASGAMLILLAFVAASPHAMGQRVILSEDFESDTPDTQPASADHYARGCVQFVNCATEPAKIVVTGGAFADPFGPGNQSLVFHNPNSAVQARLVWASIFGEDPATFRNGVVEFDAWMEKPLPLLGEPGGKFWSFFEVRTGYGGPERSQISTVNDVTVWSNFRIQNIFGRPDPVDQAVDAGGRYSIGFEPTFTDGAQDIFGPDRSFHVRIEINGGDGTPGSESYVLKINDTPITWMQTAMASSPWVPAAPGINMLGLYSDASAFFSGGAANAYIDNLVVINNDLPPLPALNGDYNDNGTVDAADYVVWQNSENTNTALPNDPVGGTIGAAQYNQWRANFGAMAGASAGSISMPLPEPGTLVGFMLALGACCVWRPPGRREAL